MRSSGGHTHHAEDIAFATVTMTELFVGTPRARSNFLMEYIRVCMEHGLRTVIASPMGPPYKKETTLWRDVRVVGARLLDAGLAGMVRGACCGAGKAEKGSRRLGAAAVGTRGTSKLLEELRRSWSNVSGMRARAIALRRRWACQTCLHDGAGLL